MADDRIRHIIDLFRNPGEETVTEGSPLPADGKTVWILGRGEGCDLVYSASKISRRHCKIEYLDSHFYLTDLDSTNGTYLNGRRIERKERLFAGDIIGIGPEDIVFSPDMLK